MARQQGLDANFDTKAAKEFVGRYMQGEHTKGFAGEEALAFYDAVVPTLDLQQFEQAATGALSRMGVDEREQLARFLTQRAHSQEYNFPELSVANEHLFGDAAQLARILCALENKQPGILRDMMGPGGSAAKGSLTGEGKHQLDSLLFKATIGGIAAHAIALQLGIQGGAAVASQQP
jgi:hypothetical protein